MRHNIIHIFILSFFIINCNSKNNESQIQSIPKIQDYNENNAVSSYTIDIENSNIKWVGKKIASSHEGLIKISSGDILMKGNHVQSGLIIVDMVSIENTDIENEKYRNKLNGHLKNEDFFNVDSFPTSTLKINSSHKLNDSKFSFLGDLTIKGITHPVEFEGNINSIDDKYSAIIKLNFDRTLWEIQYGSGQFFDDLGDRMILDNIELEIEIITQ